MVKTSGSDDYSKEVCLDHGGSMDKNISAFCLLIFKTSFMD
jgi:hypothetical protein